MKNFMLCRRTFIATFAVASLLVLGWVKGEDVAMGIATVAVGLAGANAYEGTEKARVSVVTEYKG
jgi:hypothetical protein